jgi:hypothetical protein
MMALSLPTDADTCLATIRDWQEFDLFFLETPLPSDDLEGYARLATEQPIPIAAGEWLTTRFEFRHLMEQGKIKVVQPDIGRVGGLTEARRVCEMARQRGLIVVPHLWKTGKSIAAALHLAAAMPNCPYIEFLPAELSESALRRDRRDRRHARPRQPHDHPEHLHSLRPWHAEHGRESPELDVPRLPGAGPRGAARGHLRGRPRLNFRMRYGSVMVNGMLACQKPLQNNA